jgi:hypothetical protein
MKPDMTFSELLKAGNPEDEIQLLGPDPGGDPRRWRLRIRGRGVYIGDVHIDEIGDFLLADPHTFLPDN